MKAVLTGGAGKLGDCLVPCLACAYEVAVFNSVAPRNLDAEHYIGDITDYAALCSAFGTANAVVHLAPWRSQALGQRNEHVLCLDFAFHRCPQE